jgi:membrane-bound metal-dependent hydrolase YbcI (DUF457 family)
MDTITHGIVGALTGKAFFAGRDVSASSPGQAAESSPTARAAILACTLGSVFPDIDVFAGPIARNPLAMIEWHRNVTHSLVLLPFWALLLAAMALPLARWLSKRYAGWTPPSFAMLAGCIAVGLGTHLLLDVVTNFGTMLWSPLNYSRPALDWIFIVDLTFTGMALLPQIAAWCYREPSKFLRRAAIAWIALSVGALGTYLLADAVGFGFSASAVGVVSAVVAAVIVVPVIGDTGFAWKRSSWSRVGIFALCAYLAAAALHHHIALADVENYAAQNHLQVRTLAAMPLPPSVMHWSGLIETPEGVWRTTFHVPGGKTESRVLYADAGSNHLIEEAKKLHDVQIYLWFARFPLWRVQPQGDQTIVKVTDVRFFRDDSEAGDDSAQQNNRSGGLRINAAGFTFAIVFDANGNVVSHGFERPAP